MIKQLTDAGLTGHARVVVEKPFGHDLASARALAAEIHQYIDESQLYRIDHFLGKMGTDELLYLRFANTMIEPVWNRNHIACVQITMAEDFGVEDRGHFYDPVGALRDVVVNHLMQVSRSAAMEAPAGRDAKTLKDAKDALFRAIADGRPGATTCAASTTATCEIDGVAPDSTTETYTALRLDIDNWRWSGVPWFIRTGKCLPVTQTEIRAVFREPPRLGFMERGAPPSGAQPVGRQARPGDGDPADLGCPPRRRGRPAADQLDMEFAREGGEGPTPYEVLLLDAIDGDARDSRVRTVSRRPGGSSSRCSMIRPPCTATRGAPGGPRRRDQLLAGFGRWRGPWVVS